MFTVGLTGSFKTGKSSVSKMFKKLGAKIIDSDKIVHSILANNKTCIKEIKDEFGDVVVLKGVVDKKRLSNIVFSNKKSLKKLEKIIHPRVRRVVLKELNKIRRLKTNKVVIVDVPLLFESGFNKLVDVTVVVRATQNQQILRAKKELGMLKQEALKRIKMQMSLSNKIRKADFIIDNRRSLNETRKQVEKLWRKW